MNTRGSLKGREECVAIMAGLGDVRCGMGVNEAKIIERGR